VSAASYFIDNDGGECQRDSGGGGVIMLSGLAAAVAALDMNDDAGIIQAMMVKAA